MPNYKEELQSNNTNLQGILDSVNALPEASGGGASVETCTVTVTLSKTTTLPAGFRIYYTALSGGEMKMHSDIGYTTPTYVQAGTLAVFDCVKNTMISISASAKKLKFTIPDGYDYIDSEISYAVGMSVYSSAIAPNADGEIIITYG